MHATISLYIFYPIFKEHFFVFKEVFSESSVLMYGLYSRVASNQVQLMIARTVFCFENNYMNRSSIIP